MTKNHRGRFREHLSTNHDQLCFRLETSGITLDKDMFLSNGMLGLDLHKECFKFRTPSEQQQHQQQEKNTAVTNIILPRRYDAPFFVLFSKRVARSRKKGC